MTDDQIYALSNAHRFYDGRVDPLSFARAILQAATPNGWKLVPIDPPSTMLDEIAQVDDISYAALLARYRKMLAAVPILQAATRDAPEYHSQGEVRRFMLDANVDGVEQFLEFVLAKEHDALIHDLETRCDPAGLVQENGLLKDQTRQLDAMIGRLKAEAQDADEPLNCDFCGVSVDDPWHTSDATRKHLHQCDACHAIATTRATPADHSVPVALLQPQVIERCPNRAYVTMGFDTVEECSTFIKLVTAPQALQSEAQSVREDHSVIGGVLYQILASLGASEKALDLALAFASNQPLPFDPMKLLPYATSTSKENS